MEAICSAIESSKIDSQFTVINKYQDLISIVDAKTFACCQKTTGSRTKFQIMLEAANRPV